MEQLNHVVGILALTMGAAWASGINVYAAVLVLGIMGATGNIQLPPDLLVLQNPIVIAAAGVMFVIEFFADKVPGVDTGWDAIQTFVRIPAGAVLAAGAVGPVSPPLTLAAGILGGAIAGTTHATKSGSRVLINTSPEPFSNWIVSFTEDIAVIGGLFVALHHPWIFLILFILFILFLVWLLPKIWRGVRSLINLLGRIFGRKDAAVSEPVEAV